MLGVRAFSGCAVVLAAAHSAFGGDPTGACCVGEDLCTDGQTEAACLLDACAVWHGPGSTCGAVTCEQQFGACCEAGVCRLVEYPVPGCPVGEFQGCGTGCGNASICPPALGACCLDDTCIPDIEEKDCNNQCGSWQGVDTLCDGSCPIDDAGACCVDGTCTPGILMDACTCIPGAEWVDGTSDCGAVSCMTPPTGGCCIDGSCQNGLTEYDCVVNFCGNWQGPGPGCAACLLSNGVCCVNGSCNGSLGRDSCECAGGTFHAGVQNCNGFICSGGPTGACCVDGACTRGMTQEECVVDNCGAWQGAGSACGPACPATLPGVCCRNGVCDDSVQHDACLCTGGIWDDSTLTCSGFTCPIPTGRCCYGNTCTPDLTLDQCGCGLWGGPDSECPSIDPGGGGVVIGGNSCRLATGACCLPDGSCAANLGQATCTCEGGIWRPGGGCNLANANHDCDSDGDSDWCDVPFIDCNNNGQPDTCEEDCNLNSTVDECDVASQDSPDCNDNVIPDECEIDENSTAPGGPYYCTSNCAVDCNNNGVPDECDVSGGASPDCNTNGVPDECEIDENSQAPGGPYFCTMDCADDCNDNGIPDECELDPDCSLNLGVDCNFDGQLDACDADCNSTATSDICELILSPANGLLDCSGVGGQVGSAFFGKLIHDANCAACHAEGGFGGIGPNHRGLSRFRFQQKTSGCVSHVGGPFDFSDQQYADLQAWLSELGGGGNGIPDECEGLADCDSDGIADACALTQRVNPSEDCDGNSIPDECDIASNLHEDCNGNGVPDLCEPQTDCNTNNQIDECDILQGISQDCSGNGIPDECEADCQPNGIADSCDIDAGTSQDCDGNGVPDECEPDCQPNGVADACDISSGASQDVNSNAIPDECEADCNGNGLPDDLDLEPSDNGTNHTVDHSGQPQGGLLIPECDGQSTAQLVDTAVVDFGPACSTIEVLRVGVQIEHTWLGDVVAEVESPQGTVVTLFSRPGLTELDPTCPGGECCGSGANTMDALFGDGFPTSVETTSGFVGSFHADAGATGNGSELAAFTGEPFCGTWALRVYDASEYDEGVLQAWSLNFLAEPLASDCNNNSVPDACEIDEGSTAPGGPYYCTSVCDPDCNNNGIPDNCEDCNGNGVADSCDLAAATSPDCNGNAIPDECEAYRDCNSNGIMDACDLDSDAAVDCDQNGAPDTCDIAGTAGFFVTGALSGNVAEFDPVSSSLYEDLVTNEEGGLFIPFDMAWTPTGNILVGSVIPSTIREFDGDSGAFLREVVTGTASQNGNLATPFDIEIHPDGSLLVMDFPSTVKRYDYTFGSYMGPFITLPNNESAYDMQYAPTGELLIANFTTGEILAYDGVTGTLVGPYTTGGTLLNPSAMAFNAAGELFVADSNLANDNIQRFDASGTFVEVYVPFLATGGQALLGKLAFGPDDQLYATHGSVGAVIRFHDDDPTMFDQFDTSTVAFPVGLLFRPASNDCNSNAVPDECEDCNGNALADSCDIAGGFSQDVDGNQIPDECEGADVSLGVTVRAAPGDSDSELSLPASDPTVPHGEPFVIELWATDRGPVNSGLLQIATELSFTPDIITALFIEHRPPFTDSTFGFIDNAAGTIGSLGGFNGAMDIVGIEPEWRRIAIVHSFASDCGMAQLGTSEDLPGIFRIGRGLISNVDYGSGAVEVVRDCTYDLDGSGFINAAEVGLFSPCWLTSHGEPGYDAACDFDCSGTVDAGDLGWFAGAWMQFCTDLTDDDVPPCQRCGQAEIPDGGEGDGEGIVLRRKRHTRRVVPRTDTTARIGWRWTGPRSIDAGSSLVLEILLRDDSVGARGLAAAFVDVGFDPAQVSVQNATIDTAMGLFAEQVVSQGTIRVGGSSMVGAGSSEWAPLARVTFVAQQALRQPPAIRVAPAHSGVSSVGAGTIAPQHIRVEPLP